MSPKHVAPALKRMSMHRHTNNVLPPWRAENEVEGLAAQVTVLLHAGAPSRLHKGRAQIGVALARAARQALAAAPFVAGTDSFCRQSSTCHSGARPSPAWLPIVHENVFENGSGLEE